ncbi:type II secretion system F family protein [Spongisporangium articulatum]|uniref:Type II secretion system F family protein n=1 Tax=Spongisporangium articulatum TaxID=3362603 RepID=A0ABW8AIX1_9ACTN
MTGRAGGPHLSREDVIDLTGRLCALARAGVGPREAWAVLAGAGGAAGEVALVVHRMLAAGGSAAAGLHAVAGSAPGASLEWLALTLEVGERSGAPASLVIDGVGEALLAELARAGEREVAMAASRATARLLAGLPALGVVLGFAMGTDVPRVLLLTGAGRICLGSALAFWWAGWAWSRRLVAAAVATGARA